MKNKRNATSVKGRGEYLSVSDFILQYFNNLARCIEVFFNIRWPNGYFCEKCNCKEYYYIKENKCYRCKACHHDEYLYDGTAFQNTKLPANVILYALFLIFTSTKGISSYDLARELKVNYKTACHLQTRARILMSQSNSRRCIDSKFYEADVAYVGASSHGKRGLGTDKQPVLVVLGTTRKNDYLTYVKIKDIPLAKSEYIKPFILNNTKLSNDRTLTTDGKTTFACLSNQVNLDSHVINYDDPYHDLHYLNIVISNMQSNIQGIYHGISKRELPLYLEEYEWRFNHRSTDSSSFIERISRYIKNSDQMTKRSITNALDQYMISQAFELL